jgi:hypothetical protein
MTTAMKTGPLHKAVDQAGRQRIIVVDLIEHSRKELEQVRARDQDLSARIKEVLIAKEMGTKPADNVESLRNERATLAEDIERTEARVTGLERKLELEILAQIMASNETLNLAKATLAEKMAKEVCERIDQAAIEFQQIQRRAIALARLLDQLQIETVLRRDLIPTRILYAEILSSHGGGWGVWPHMGKSKTGEAEVAGQMEALRAELEAL